MVAIFCGRTCGVNFAKLHPWILSDNYFATAHDFLSLSRVDGQVTLTLS
jgi:hypothetical protein